MVDLSNAQLIIQNDFDLWEDKIGSPVTLK